MPLTDFQREVFATLRINRNPDSYVFGATVLNSTEQTPRYSRDIDLCHDSERAVSDSAQADESALLASGFEVAWEIRRPLFQVATVVRGTQSVKLEWVYDTAFRFFPVEADDEMGWRLHYADAAINKVLALSGRAEPRDFVDSIFLETTYLSLGAMAWAAAGKDEGLNPMLILELASRFARYRQSDMDRLDLATPVSLPDLDRRWRDALERGRHLVCALPPDEVGCLYLHPESHAVTTPDPDSPDFPSLIRHRGSIGGAWPRLSAL